MEEKDKEDFNKQFLESISKKENRQIKPQHKDKFFLYRRGTKDNRNLDKSTKKLKRFCGYETKKEIEDREIHSKIISNLSKISF